MNYVVVPGLMGTELIADRYVFDQRIWLNYLALAADGFPLLTLDSTGTAPLFNPTLKGWKIGTAISGYYSPLINQIATFGPTVVFGYDWRLSIQTNALLLSQMITRIFGAAPVKIVAHSLGGLVARGAMKYLKAAGADAQVQQLVTLGTPHYGCYSPMTGFARFAPTYQRLLLLASIVRNLNLFQGAAIVDPVLATFPSIYELMPFTTVGPMASNPVLAAQFYLSSTYSLFNSYVSQTRLTAALTVQTWLSDAGDPARTSSLQGTEVTTPLAVSSLALVGTPFGYSYTSEGDGTVPRSYADWAGAQQYYFAGIEHSTLPIARSVLDNISTILGAA